MKKKNIIILTSGALLLLMLFVICGNRSDKKNGALPDSKTSSQKSGSFMDHFSLFSNDKTEDGKHSLGDNEKNIYNFSAEDLDPELAMKELDVSEVTKKMSEQQKPYETEAERQELLKGLKQNETFMKGWINKTEENIASAAQDGSRTEAEMAEANEALGQMKEGLASLQGKIKQVENDDFNKK